MMTVIRAAAMVGSLGVNTHIDFASYGYQNLATVEASITYLGLRNLRDSPQVATDPVAWLKVAQATGARFDAYIPEASPAGMAASLALIPLLAAEGILNAVEGGNEEDDAYPASLGNTLPLTALLQQEVFAIGQSLGLPVINMSFGAGWTASNDWQGDYSTVGDLSAYCSLANAHTYPMPGQAPDWAMQRLNGLANLAAASRAVTTTEIGWDRGQGFSQRAVASYVLEAAMDGIKDGDAKTYFYALFDDGAGAFGLMNRNGTPLKAGTALHNLTTLLADPASNAATFATGTLGYRLAHATRNDNSLLFEKSNGTYWIALWNESDAAHKVTLALTSRASDIKLFDPLLGTVAIADAQGASSLAARLNDHPLLVEVTP